MKNRCIVVFVLTAFLVNTVFAQKGDYKYLFSEEKLKMYVKFLSDDGFEGRAPGTRTGELAAKFLAMELQRFGVKPGNKGSYFQPVSLVAVKANPDTKLRVSGRNTSSEYDFGKDFVVTTGAQTENVNVDAELVFVGYGIDAPEQKWNDYKGNADDYRGKILVMLVNDPPATEKEPNLFGGRALTYYGRWTYKYEEAARRGAVGAILIHTTESAGYGWNVVETSNGNWRYEVARTIDDKSPFLQIKSWVTEETARRIFSQGGYNLDDLRRQAKDRSFKPVNLGIRASLNLKSELKRLESNNVIGIWEGSDANLKNEYVVYTAHWDHLGIGKPNAKGDNIYNGALDNSSGCAQVLALAEAFTKLPKKEQPKRSQVFLFTTAEEQGLLGAEWYATRPIFPLEKTAANINIDGGNFLGLTRNFGALGAERSDLWEIVQKVLKSRNLNYLPDRLPEQGFFFRSDHFPFAKAGVPALSIQNGDDYVGKPKDFAEKFFQDYNRNHYHQPSDEFNDDWRFDGMVQSLDVVMAIALEISNMKKMPHYNKTDEFSKAQPNRK
jgi:Zn-dependent M28 family amino/carboxypeptidase